MGGRPARFTKERRRRRALHFGRERRETPAISGATGGVDFRRVRGSAVWSGDGGCRRGIHGKRKFLSLRSVSLRGAHRVHARQQQQQQYMLSVFFVLFLPRKDANFGFLQEKKAKRHKKSKISSSAKKI